MKTNGLAAILLRVGTVLGINTVPVIGWLREAWSAETVMVLYYLETVVVVLLAGLMVRLVVPATDGRGRNIARQRNRLARDYWLVMGGFALVIGFFMAVMLLLFLAVPVPWPAVGAAMTVIVTLQVFSYSWEAYRLRPLDIADAEHLVNRDMGRIAILHLGVLFGVFLAAVRSDWFVWPFLILKTTVDIAGVLAQLNGRASGALRTGDNGEIQ